MISLLSAKAVDVFVDWKVITESDRELYAYGFFMLFSEVFYLFASAFIGALFGITIESVVFFTLFSILRGYAGGIHANSERVCLVSTLGSIFISVFFIWIGCHFALSIPFVLLLAINMPIVLVLSPQDTMTKRLTIEEKKLYRRKTTIVILAMLLLCGIVNKTHMSNLFYCCSVCVTLESALLVLGILFEENNNNK